MISFLYLFVAGLQFQIVKDVTVKDFIPKNYKFVLFCKKKMLFSQLKSLTGKKNRVK